MRRAVWGLAASAVLILPHRYADARILDGGINYVPPVAPLVEVPNTREFSSGFDKTWQAVVEYLSDTAFVIDNIDKASGLITLSFSLDNPNQYIDCGSMTTWVKNLRGRRDYAFDGASAHERYEVLLDGSLTGVERQLSLSGKANILVSLESESVAKVKVVARYVANMRATYSAFLLDNNFNRLPPKSISTSNAFNTGQEGRFDSGVTVCRPRGRFESGLLDGFAKSLPPMTAPIQERK